MSVAIVLLLWWASFLIATYTAVKRWEPPEHLRSRLRDIGLFCASIKMMLAIGSLIILSNCLWYWHPSVYSWAFIVVIGTIIMPPIVICTVWAGLPEPAPPQRRR